MIWLCLALALVSLVISLPLTAAVRSISHRFKALDSAGSPGHTKELRPVPNTGGIAIFWAIVLPMLAGLAAAHWVPEELWQRFAPQAAPHLAGIRAETRVGLTLIACLAALHGVGLIDDRKALGPGVKSIVMVAAAATIALTSDTLLLTMLAPKVGGAWLSILLTILWIVAITNAMNFIDNMDGLAGGVGAIASACFMAAAALQGQWFVAASLALLVGALLGFLAFNRPPASIFMGDGGSLVLGFLLAFLTVRTTYYGTAAGRSDALVAGAWYGVFMPVVILAVPLYDLITVTTVRLARGKSPLVASPDHLSHRLTRRGLTKPEAVAVICGLTAVTGLGGVILGTLQPWQAAVVGFQIVLLLLVLAAFEWRSAKP